MGKIIKFSEAQKINHQSQNSVESIESDSDLFYFSLFSHLKDDRSFLGILEQWPCFYEEPFKGGLRILFQRYCDGQLNKSQESVVDLMLHIHDPRFSFDITLSLSSWNEDDRSFFLYFLEKHAEAISDLF